MGVSINFIADSVLIAATDSDDQFSVIVFEDTDYRRNSLALSLRDKGLAEAIKNAVNEYKSKNDVMPSVPVITVIDFEKLM